jgi:hypothetical protein
MSEKAEKSRNFLLHRAVTGAFFPQESKSLPTAVVSVVTLLGSGVCTSPYTGSIEIAFSIPLSDMVLKGELES